MRHVRGAKFSEYLSTYALQQAIGLHPTLLIERRDATRGYGLFARDACDADTVMLVVPLRNVLSARTLNQRGASVPSLPLPVSPSATIAPLTCGLLNTQQDAAGSLIHRLALELHAPHSRWWGWLSSAPELSQMQELRQAATKAFHVRHGHHTVALTSALQRILQDESVRLREWMGERADEGEEPYLLVPSQEKVTLAHHLVLARSLVLPCFGGSTGEEALTTTPSLELCIPPLLDLCNGPSRRQSPQKPRSHSSPSPVSTVNCHIELATTESELPEWYRTNHWYGDGGARVVHNAGTEREEEEEGEEEVKEIENIAAPSVAEIRASHKTKGGRSTERKSGPPKRRRKRNGVQLSERQRSETLPHGFALLVSTTPVTAAEELIVDYDIGNVEQALSVLPEAMIKNLDPNTASGLCQLLKFGFF